MNKLDASPSTFTIASASPRDLKPAPRLIVLFPSSETETPELEHRIWEIARSLHLNVVFLGLASDFEEETQLRRNLITMAAIIRDPNVSTEIIVEHGSDWVKPVRKIWRTGDIVACYAGQKTGFIRKSLDQILRSTLDAQIYILSDHRPAEKPGPAHSSQVLFWLGALAIIGGFLWAEVNIVKLPQDWTHTMMIYICIFLEVTLLWLWNSLFT